MPQMQGPPGPETIIDGRPCLYFAGTGYLGLQGHPGVIRAAREAAETYGISSATSRSLFGETVPLVEVEHRAAEFFGSEDAFYFMSGYVAVDVVVGAIAGEFDALLADERSHGSVLQAARLCGLPLVRFGHGDPESLEKALRRALPGGGRPLVASDGVFAVHGRIAPVAEYAEVLRRYPGSGLVVDDAHALGVLGVHGRGTLEHAGLWSDEVNGRVPEEAMGDRPSLWTCGTLSKALGGYGGIVPGSRAFVERLKKTSPYFTGTTPLPTPVAAATAKALELAIAQPELRTRLAENARRLKAGLGRLGLPTDDTPVPIAALELGDGENMRRIQARLAEQGIAVAYVAGYGGTGPHGVLRLAVFATHTPAMIDRLLDALGRVI